MTTVHTFDPLVDGRWLAFLAQHPNASVFHTPGWLAALRRTYRYKPLVVTTSAPGEDLRNGIVLCGVQSWLTGSRMVSVPFSDHCQPLADNAESLALLISALKERQESEKWKYVELRPLGSLGASLENQTSFSKNEQFYFHELDLRPDLDTLFRNFHKSCMQRKIQRSEREQLAYEEGRSEPILSKFYQLLLLTRRRHQLPPQPLSWFRNLRGCLGEKLSIRIASKDGQPVAGILTLAYKNTLVYKYGCSDASFHSLGGMPFLFWKAIQESKQSGAQQLDLGRSETDNPGLVAFKDHLGAKCSRLYYFRACLESSRSSITARRGDWRLRLAKRAFARMPDSVLKMTGNLLYRYVG